MFKKEGGEEPVYVQDEDLGNMKHEK